MTPPPVEQQDIRAYLRALWRWKFLLLLFLLVVPAISYFLEERKPREYRSNALVQVQGVAIDSSLFQGASSVNVNIQTVARLVETTAIANAAAKLLNPPPPQPAALLGAVAVEADTATGFIDIAATSTDPRRAADIANAFATAISANRAAVAIGQLNFAIGGIKRQIENLAPADNVGRSQLSGQLQRLRALRASQGRNAAIVERAVPSGTPLGRSTRRAIELGIVIALLLGAGAVALAETSDRKLRSADQVEELTGVPLLSAIPSSAFSAELSERSRDAEAFQMLRAALTYFNIDRRVASVVITSPGQEDGKTTVAVRLAFALAHAGKNVILVDADLRHPRIGPRLGLRNGGGLGDVVVGERQLSDVLVEFSLDEPGAADTPTGGRLRVLPAGGAAPNPAELLSSTALQRLMSALEVQADFVIVDTAAALAVSDALPLLQSASGVLLVARLNRTTKAAVRRLHRVITAANGTILGVVATGASSRAGYEYGYGYGYAPAQDGQGSRRSRRKAAATSPPQA
jgi:capsular exopolysaccharide synthesis family protein